MLLSNDEFDIESLDYTEMFQSKKRDGVRVEVSNKGLLNRSLKVLRNIKVQEYFKNVYENLPEGIILEAEVNANDIPCRIIAGVCNSDAHDIPAGLKLYLFGIFIENNERSFLLRYEKLKLICKQYCKGDRYEIIEQVRVYTAKEASVKEVAKVQEVVQTMNETKAVETMKKEVIKDVVIPTEKIEIAVKKYKKDVIKEAKNTDPSQRKPTVVGRNSLGEPLFDV